MNVNIKNYIIALQLLIIAVLITKYFSISAESAYIKRTKKLACSMMQSPVPGSGIVTTNFDLRKPNFVVIHHSALDSLSEISRVFNDSIKKISAHYIIERDGTVHHVINDYLRAWHAGVSKWSSITDMNSCSLGIELVNNGKESFAKAQINSLLKLLAKLKQVHNIPAANFIGHSDIAPIRKQDPSAFFPWSELAKLGFGLWYDSASVAKSLTNYRHFYYQSNNSRGKLISNAKITDHKIPPLAKLIESKYPQLFADPSESLRIIGYDTHNLADAIKAFKLHFIQHKVDTTLTEYDMFVLYDLRKKH